MRIYCHGVNIRFKNQNLQQQRMRSGDISTSHYLTVIQDDVAVHVLYCRDEKMDDTKTAAFIVKALVFNWADVVELEIEDTIGSYLQDPIEEE